MRSQSVRSTEAASVAAERPARRGRFRLRWIVLGATALVLMLNYADRAAIGVAGPGIKDLGLTATRFGLLASAFFFGYVPFAFIGGWLSDKIGPRWVMGVAVAWWSLFTAHRRRHELPQSVHYPHAFRIRRRTTRFGRYEDHEQLVPSTADVHRHGICSGCTPRGGAIGTPLVVGLITVVDWRAAFVVIGAVGIVCTIGWFAVVRDTPELHPWSRQQDITEQQELAAPLAAASAFAEDVPPMRHYFKQPLILATAAAFFGYAWVLYTFLTWFPVYLTEERGVDLKGLAIAGTIPWVFGVIGLILGGLVTDAIDRKTGKPIAARARVIVVGLLVTAAGFGFTGIVATTEAAVALMAVVVFALYFTCAQYFVIVAPRAE